MTTLSVFDVDDLGPPRRARVTADPTRIARELGDLGVEFERWRREFVLPHEASQDDVLGAYRADVDRFMSRGYQSVDVVTVLPDRPDVATLRRKFLAEHTHDEDEVRFFVDGAAAFYIRSGARVLKLVVERGDLLRLPKGTRHWFDMGPSPHFTAIRIFTTPDGWVGRFTGDPVAERLPEYLP